jgi:hypothetical protein
MQAKFIDIYLKIYRFSSIYKPLASIVDAISSSTTSTPLRNSITTHLTMATFTLFPILPTELRCKIWDAACFVNPRVFELEREKCSLTSFPTPRSWRAASFRWMDCADTPFWVAKRCKYPTPSVLLVCKEAYQESKKSYR